MTSTVSPLASAIDRVLFGGIVAVLLFGPLAFGIVEPWSVMVLQVAAALLLALWAGRQWIEGEVALPGGDLLRAQCAFVALIVLQLLFHLTAYGYATRSALELLLVYIFIFILAAHSFRSPEALRVLGITFSGFGFVIAVFAIIQSVTSNGKIYWLRSVEAPAQIFGPYVNHNHYAGLMELLVPIPMAIALTPAFPRPQRVMAAFAAMVMGASIFVSLSRGGMIAFLAETAFLGLLLFGLRGGRRIIVTVGTVLLVTVCFLAWFSGSQVAERITGTAAEWKTDRTAGRWATDKDAWTMFERKPIAGFGLDVFPDIYPKDRSYYTNEFVNEAHNDHLQLLVETGIIGYGLMVWFVFEVFRRGLAKVRGDHNVWVMVMTAAALAGCAGMLIHAFSDFNFHVPANAALFSGLSAVAAAAAPRRRRHGGVT